MIRLFCLQLGPLGSGTPFALASVRQHCTGVTQRKKDYAWKANTTRPQKHALVRDQELVQFRPVLDKNQTRVWPSSTKLSSIHLFRLLVKGILKAEKEHKFKKTLVGKALHYYFKQVKSKWWVSFWLALRERPVEKFKSGEVDYCYFAKVEIIEFRLCNFLKKIFRNH